MGNSRGSRGERRVGVRETGVTMAELDEELLKIMVCPITHAPVVQVGDWVYSTDPKARHKYPIRDGIPIMLIDEARVVDQEEFDRVMAKARADRDKEGETS